MSPLLTSASEALHVNYQCVRSSAVTFCTTFIILCFTSTTYIILSLRLDVSIGIFLRICGYGYVIFGPPLLAGAMSAGMVAI